MSRRGKKKRLNLTARRKSRKHSRSQLSTRNRNRNEIIEPEPGCYRSSPQLSPGAPIQPVAQSTPEKHASEPKPGCSFWPQSSPVAPMECVTHDAGNFQRNVSDIAPLEWDTHSNQDAEAYIPATGLDDSWYHLYATKPMDRTSDGPEHGPESPLLGKTGEQEPKVHDISGRRIVDIGYVFKRLKEEKHRGGTDCSFMDMNLIAETRRGMESLWTFKCAVCNVTSSISSEDKSKASSYMGINLAAVSGAIAIGAGYSQMTEFFSAMDVPCMSSKVAAGIYDAAVLAMIEAGREEAELARKEGKIDTDGVPMCAVVADGQWCKRSYKTNYDSLSGVVSYDTHAISLASIHVFIIRDFPA